MHYLLEKGYSYSESITDKPVFHKCTWNENLDTLEQRITYRLFNLFSISQVFLYPPSSSKPYTRAQSGQIEFTAKHN